MCMPVISSLSSAIDIGVMLKLSVKIGGCGGVCERPRQHLAIPEVITHLKVERFHIMLIHTTAPNHMK